MMKLRRISGQPSETLEEFYTQLNTDPEPWAGIGYTMVCLLHHLEQHDPGSEQWAHTAHTTLVLDASDNYETSQVYIEVAGGVYIIRCTILDVETPWSGASVVGQTADVAEASQIIHIALARGIAANEKVAGPAYPAMPPNGVSRMHLHRISHQQPETLADYYIQLRQYQHARISERSQAMLDLIRYLDDPLHGTATWVYTTDVRLILTDADRPGPGVAVYPASHTPPIYILTYPLPSAAAPWLNAYMETSSGTMEHVNRLLQLAMAHIFHSNQ
jgi:hypothetical protein